VVSSEQTVAGERRHLTILFCDLVGSVTLTSRVDPEEWQATVASYQRTASEAITRFGGEVVRYIGDGIMAFFGYPVAHENDAERAARAGLAIVEAIAHQDEQLGKPKLAVRIGIDSGLVVVGIAAQAVDAYGDTANIAARVQALAEPGTVAVTAATHRLFSGLFVVEDRGPQTLKGIERPVRLYRVIRPSGMRSRFEVTVAAGGLTPFVGREDELRLLLNRWERTRDGEGQVALVVGEAGIGKSRLVQRVREELTGTPHTWIEAGAGEFFQNTPFYPIIEMLRQLFGGATAQDQLTDLALRLTVAGLKPTDAIPLLASLLNLPLSPEYPPSTLAPEQQRRRLLATLVEWVLGSARAQPLVIVIEDLHWADPSTLEVIQLLVEQAVTATLLLIYTARPEFHPPWLARAHHTQITLNRLNSHQVRKMVSEVAARKALSEETVGVVVERTGGVPLFVEELTRAVLESGNGKLSGKTIPVTLHDSLMARLDKLGAAKEVAQIGAVIGGEFSYDLLHAVHPIPDPDLQQALLSLTDAELLYARGLAPEATYKFKHALIRDAAYEALLKSRRKELHLIVARTIDEKFPAIRETQPEVLALHWAEAGEAEPEIAAWQKAGERAVEHSAYREAEQHYRYAIAVLQQLPESAERDRHELELQLAYGPILIAMSGWASKEAEQAYARARALCERESNQRSAFQALFGLWVNHLVRSEFRTADDIAQDLLQRARVIGAPIFLLHAHQAIGDTSYSLGKFTRAREHLEEAITLCGDERQKALGVDMEIVARSYAAATVQLLGYPDQALRRIEMTVALAHSLSDPFSLAFANNFLIGIQLRARDAPAAEASARRQIALCAEHGFVYWHAHDSVLLGGAMAKQGRGEEAVEQIERALEAVTATGGNPTREDFLGCTAIAYSAIGRSEDALNALERALSASEQYGEHVHLAETFRMKGELLLETDSSKIEETRRCFEQAIEISRNQSARFWELRATTSLARLLASGGSRHEACERLAEIYNWFTEGFDTRDLKEAKKLLDELSL
jgi:class 3 adenylate cyclase/tetratricopeptide (TPR) repeat protein